MDCTVAPSNESIKAPARPAPVAASPNPMFPVANDPAPPTTNAPASAAAVPAALTAPDSPERARFQSVIRRGFRPQSEPISVAQVSAFAVASAPSIATSTIWFPGKRPVPTAANAAIPPFASTCDASRVPPFSKPNASLRRFPRRDNSVEVVKNVNNAAVPVTPPPVAWAQPTRVAATAPDTVSARNRQAVSATPAAKPRSTNGCTKPFTRYPLSRRQRGKAFRNNPFQSRQRSDTREPSRFPGRPTCVSSLAHHRGPGIVKTPKPVGRLADTDAGGDRNLVRGNRLAECQKEVRTRIQQRRVVVGVLADLQRTGQTTRSRPVFPKHSGWFKWLQRPDENRLANALRLGYHVQTMVDPVVDMNIRPARRTEHGAVRRRATPERMAGRIVVGVRLGFHNATTPFCAVGEATYQQGTEQIPGYFRCGTQQEFARERFHGNKAGYHRNAMQGVLVVDKPAGWTSQDVVSKVRGILRTKRAGHAGTLDPDATGVLVVAVGAATRLLPWLDLEPKEYLATVSFGSATNTEDASGTVTATADASALDWDTLNTAAARFVGEIDQVPPMVSALHHQGKRLHELARAGITVERPPRRIVIHELQLSDFRPGFTATASLRVVCGGGTYVRTLCADLASAVGLPGHMATLRRSRVGAFRIEQAVPISEVKPELVLPVEEVLGHFPRFDVDPDSATRLRHGMDIDAPEGWADCETAVLLADGHLLALASCAAGKLAPFRVFAGDSAA